MSTFAELNLSNDALKAVERLEYTLSLIHIWRS